MDKATKERLVSDLNVTLKEMSVLVVSHYKGLSVSELARLRIKVREADGFLKVIKNRLVKLALRGTDFEGAMGLFVGPTIVACSKDPVVAPKILAAFAKQNVKLVIIGGAFGTTVLDADGVASLAAIPSHEELRAKLVGLISMPAIRVVRTIGAPAGKLARVIKAYEQKSEAA